jgi:hypothetical protein
MKTNKTGLVLYWIAVVYIVVLGLGGSWLVRPIYRQMTLEQANQTIWALNSPMFGLWVSSVAIGSILAGIGMLLYVRSKGSRIWFFGLGIFAVLLIDILIKWHILPTPAHTSLLFGVGGALMVAFFLIILWFWAKKRLHLEGPDKTAAELQLAGYVFFLIAMWYLCGELARPYQTALLELPRNSPISTIVYLVLGWLFFLLSHYKSAQTLPKQE